MTNLETQKEQLPKVEELKTQEEAQNAIQSAQNKISELGVKQLETSNKTEQEKIGETIKNYEKMIQEYTRKMQTLAASTKAKVEELKTQEEEKKKSEGQKAKQKTEESKTEQTTTKTTTFNTGAETKELEAELQSEFEKVSQKSFMEGVKFLQDFAQFKVKEGDFNWLDQEEITYFKNQLPTIKAIAGSVLVGSIFENFDVSIFDPGIVAPQSAGLTKEKGSIILQKKDGKAENLNVVEIQRDLNILLRNDKNFAQTFVSGMLFSGKEFVNFAKANEKNPENITQENFKKALEDKTNLSEGEKFLQKNPELLAKVNIQELQNSPKVVEQIHEAITTNPQIIKQVQKQTNISISNNSPISSPENNKSTEESFGLATLGLIGNTLGMAGSKLADLEFGNLTPSQGVGAIVAGIAFVGLWSKFGFWKTAFGFGALFAADRYHASYLKQKKEQTNKVIETQHTQAIANSNYINQDGSKTNKEQAKTMREMHYAELGDIPFSEINKFITEGTGTLAKKYENLQGKEREIFIKNLKETYNADMKALEDIFTKKLKKPFDESAQKQILEGMTFEKVAVLKEIDTNPVAAKNTIEQLLNVAINNTTNPEEKEKLTLVLENIDDFVNEPSIWTGIWEAIIHPQTTITSLWNTTTAVVTDNAITTIVVAGIGVIAFRKGIKNILRWARTKVLNFATFNLLKDKINKIDIDSKVADAKNLGKTITGRVIDTSKTGIGKTIDTFSSDRKLFNHTISRLDKTLEVLKLEQRLSDSDIQRYIIPKYKEILEKTQHATNPVYDIDGIKNIFNELPENLKQKGIKLLTDGNISEINRKQTALLKAYTNYFEKGRGGDFILKSGVTLENIPDPAARAAFEYYQRIKNINIRNYENVAKNLKEIPTIETQQEKIQIEKQRFEDTLEVLKQNGTITPDQKTTLLGEVTDSYNKANTGEFSPEELTKDLEGKLQKFGETNNLKLKIHSFEEIAQHKEEIIKKLQDAGVIKIESDGKITSLIDTDKVKNIKTKDPKMQNIADDFKNVINFLNKTLF